MKYYKESEALDKVLGKEGSPLRDDYESQMNEFLIGEAIRQAREAKHLTQSELGELVGVKKAQISKIENGCNVTFATIARLFRAMGVKAVLDMGEIGRFAI
ncbi:MAG: helix-turn-helix domain-containing protein [Bacteroidaceae bacterium]|nr:helix-turn-helix domain-containing protein [Bacteroidaceae bacterium]